MNDLDAAPSPKAPPQRVALPAAKLPDETPRERAQPVAPELDKYDISQLCCTD